jgi:hypothetical protein
MANVIYDTACEGLWNADIDWAAGNIKTVLVDTALYTINTATDKFLDDIPAGAQVAIGPNLLSKTIVGRVIDAADTTFTAVAVGDPCEAVVAYLDTGASATSRLIIYADTATSGLPVTPNGADIVVRWNASGIATL